MFAVTPAFTGENGNRIGRSSARIVGQEMIAEDLVSGAPRNPDGTINLIEYAAWLAKEEDDADQSE